MKKKIMQKYYILRFINYIIKIKVQKQIIEELKNIFNIYNVFINYILIHKSMLK